MNRRPEPDPQPEGTRSPFQVATAKLGSAASSRMSFRIGPWLVIEPNAHAAHGNGDTASREASGEDAARGRVYLPQDDLLRFGYRVEQLRQSEQDEHFRAGLRFEVERCRHSSEAARPLSALLPPPGRAVFQVLFP
jgi:hypothetical protein